MAEWLNGTFYAFDSAIIYGINSMSCGFLTAFSKSLTLIFEKGITVLIIGLILMLFKKTRKPGALMFGSVALGFIITTLILKNVVGRARPLTVPEFKVLFDEIGGTAESGYSFPSGHVTGAMAGATAMFLSFNKKWSFVGFIGVLLVGFSRIYLIAHYPTDVIAGIVIGALSTLIGTFILDFICNLLDKNPESFISKLWYEWDIRNLFKKKTEE